MLALEQVDAAFWSAASAMRAELMFSGWSDRAMHRDDWPIQDDRAYVYVLLSGWIPCYVGKSFDPHQRFKMHRRREWWPEVTRLVVFGVSGETRADASSRALDLESAAIRSMRPVYNIAGVVG